MKITEMIISGLIKRGILYEARNCDIEFKIPVDWEGTTVIVPMKELSAKDKEECKNNVLIKFKAEHMTLRIEKE